MTNAEFSNQFDVLYNNVMSNQAPGLDEYEKSVFLTKAQEEIVKAYFNPKGNKFLEGFDGNEQRQIDFSMLMKTSTVTSFATSVFDGRTAGVKSVTIPGDAMVFVNERLEVTRGGATVLLTVVPINYMEYARQMTKPFKRPVQYQAWRIIDDATGGTNRSADLIAGPNDTIVKYVARYVKRPRAIILVDLTNEGVTIDGVSAAQTCELDPLLHETVLQRAVELAKASYAGDLSTQIALGVSSETEKGMAQTGR